MVFCESKVFLSILICSVKFSGTIFENYPYFCDFPEKINLFIYFYLRAGTINSRVALDDINYFFNRDNFAELVK